jgi:chitin synthase
MKTIVVLDLVATLILPASLIYVGYIVYITFWLGEPLSMLMLVVWAVVIGVQVLVFLLRSRWDYWWWFFVFIIFGVPVFYFLLPIYSFWHMDDFSWGATRQVSGKASAVVSKSKDETECSDRVSPMGFEVTADEYHPNTKTKSPPRKSHASGPIDIDTGMKKYSSATHQNHHPIDVDDITMDEFNYNTTYDPSKYGSAEEARNARRMRRGEC